MFKKNLVLKHNIIPDFDFTLKISKNINNQDFCVDLFQLLNSYKILIDKIPNNTWDTFKKRSNNYELINSKSIIINYTPISRAYYKLWEMLKDFKLLDTNKNLLIIGLAEGPGGFIECINNYRKKNSPNMRDKFVCMTLAPTDNSIPAWKKNTDLFTRHNIEIFYGSDGTGNLYHLENILSLQSKINKTADFVTCDGGFNFCENYEQQEQVSYQLILCQIITSLNILNKDGTLVIKIFDIFTMFTVKIIYFLTSLFKEVTITKPLTSRPANSEKYLVCQNFIGIDIVKLNRLNILVKDWYILGTQHKFVSDIFTFTVPQDFSDLIYSYNFNIISNQIKNIIKTLVLIDINKTTQITYKKQQHISAINWCKQYDIVHNN